MDAADLMAVALLAEPTRQRLYLYLRERKEPVGREEAARHTEVKPRHAAFHLDRMAEAGLLAVELAVTATLLLQNSPNAAFYLLPSRGWELLVGAGLALAQPWLRRIPGFVGAVGSLLGLVAILFGGSSADPVCARSFDDGHGLDCGWPTGRRRQVTAGRRNRCRRKSRRRDPAAGADEGRAARSSTGQAQAVGIRAAGAGVR